MSNLTRGGLEPAIRENRALALGVNLYKGKITCRGVADPLACTCDNILELIN